MLDEQFFRFPLISVPAQTLDRDPVDRRQEWQSRGRSSLQALLFVKFPLLSCNWLMLRHSLCDVMLVLAAAGCPPVSCCLFLFSGCWHWQGYWIFCPGHLTTFHTICRHHHTLPCWGSLARLGRKFQFAILKLFPEVSNHQSIPERSLIKQECYLHKMQCREEAADTELVCRHR